MKRILKVLSTGALSAVFVLPGLFGCYSSQNPNLQEDITKANITVATWDGGVGKEWLEQAAEKFEEIHKDSTQFQEGRTGVNIIVDASRNYTASSVQERPMEKDIYFTEGINYYSMINNGTAAELTDIMTGPLTDYDSDDARTILQKIDPAYRQFLNYGTEEEPEYYAIPFYDSFYGIVYDITLWEDVGLYLTEAENFGKLEQAHAGIDNVPGNSDDGLPRTYEEFALLLRRIGMEQNIVPFLSSNAGIEYGANMLYNYWVDHEGYEQFMLNLTFKGQAKDLINVKSNGSIETLPETPINFSNGYDLQKQAGKYYALTFMDDIMAGSSESYRILSQHTDAHRAYVDNARTNTSTRYAMLVEGSWWENEAKPYFNALAEDNVSRHEYAIMPIPAATTEKLQEKQSNAANKLPSQTCVSLSASYGVVNKNSNNLELALEFMRFLHTDENLRAFTLETSMTRALNYEMDDTSKMTTYGKSCLAVKENARVIYPYSDLPNVINNPSIFDSFAWAWRTDVSDGMRNPWAYFTNSGNTGDAVGYFNGLYTNAQGVWKTNNWTSGN